MVRQSWRRISSAAHAGSRRGCNPKAGNPGIARDNDAMRAALTAASIADW
jgi:hypothetical protein